MSQGLDVIIVDDDPDVCKVISRMVKSFYTWGDVVSFTDTTQAINYCQNQPAGVAVFVLDVFLQETDGFNFLDEIANKFPVANEDTIIITGSASTDVVNMCMASNINYLLEKPIRQYALQFAIRSIVSKYVDFARRLFADPSFVEGVLHA